MNTTILANHLADRFTKHLRKYVGDENMKEIARRNRKKPVLPHVCHSHDFCDANQAMIDAWKELWPEMEFDIDEHADLINEAWEIARMSW